jgi:lysophospholipase L1-like esterase
MQTLQKQAPLRVVFFGDSWLHIPSPYFFLGKPSNITQWFRKFGYKCTNKANSGNETADVYADKTELDDALKTHDCAVLSMGGNDICGKWDIERILDKETGDINWKVLTQKMELIMSQIDELIEIAEKHKKPIFMHCYDVPPVGMGGASFFWGLLKFEPKGWIRPYVSRSISNHELRMKMREILHFFFISIFNATEKYNYFHIVYTLNTIKPTKEFWRDELHPNSKGFEYISDTLSSYVSSICGWDMCQ